MSTRAYVACFVSLIQVAYSVSAGNGAEWITFAPKNLGFSIQLPTTPTERQRTDATTNKTVAGFRAERDGSVYVVTTNTLPGDPTEHGFDFDGICDLARKVHLNEPEGTLLSEKRTKVAEYPGHYAKFANREGAASYFIESRIVIVGDRSYIMKVKYPGGDRAAEQEASRFLESFALRVQRSKG